jgi:spermidine/putrescine transport system substrate-binding protein
MRIFLFIFTLFFFCGCHSSIPTLYIYTWVDFIHPKVIASFEQKFKCRILIDYFDSNESMYAKLKMGGGGDYDVITPTSYMIDIMKKQDMIEFLDPLLLPNLKNIDQYYTSYLLSSSFEYSVPYLISYSVVGYVAPYVHDFVPSWSIFFNKDLRHRMTLLDDMRETLGSALIYLEYSPNTTDINQLNEAKQVVLQWKKNIAKFENIQYRMGLDSAEFLACHGYNGDFIQIMLENKAVELFIPQEGFIISSDELAILKTAKQKELAYSFINFMHIPENAALNCEYTSFLCPNVPSYSLLPKKLRDNSAIFLNEEELKRSHCIYDLKEDNSLYTRIWDEVKSENL